MLVFYTWSIRLLADSIGLFGSVEKIGWLANHTPQEAGRLAPPTLPGGGSGGSAADAKTKRIAERKRGTAGIALPAAQVGAVPPVSVLSRIWRLPWLVGTCGSGRRQWQAGTRRQLLPAVSPC